MHWGIERGIEGGGPRRKHDAKRPPAPHTQRWAMQCLMDWDRHERACVAYIKDQDTAGILVHFWTPTPAA